MSEPVTRLIYEYGEIHPVVMEDEYREWHVVPAWRHQFADLAAHGVKVPLGHAYTMVWYLRPFSCGHVALWPELFASERDALVALRDSGLPTSCGFLTLKGEGV